MKKFIAFVIFYSLFVILCPSTNAQWEGAQVQRLTFDDLPNKMHKLYIDDNDKLYLFYLEGIRDTATGFVYRYKLLFRSKEKNGEWNQPEEIEAVGEVGYDTKNGIIHIVYARFLSLDYDTLYYTNSEIPNWQLVKIDSLSNEGNAVYQSFAMALDTLGNVHVAWHVDFDSIGYNWYRVMYANNSTGEWVKQQVSPPIWLGGMGSAPSYFDVQKKGAVHIVYHGEAYCDLECQAFYARNDSLNSTNWVTDTVPRPSRPLWYYMAGPIKVDVNDRVHLITVGCTEWDCPWEGGRTRTFYYYKQAEDSIWQGPEQIPDTMFGFISYTRQLLMDKQGIPYMGLQTSSMEAYFTDRKQESWQVPYRLVGWNEDPDSLEVDDFCFVLDSQGKGHGAFVAIHLRQLYYDDDSLEIYYLSSFSNSVVDTSQEHPILDFSLFQNYPNPFNSATSIQYKVCNSQNHPIHTSLKIYNILGKEVRELVNGFQIVGHYKVSWDGKNNHGKEVSSGIYFYLLRAGERKEGRKMLLIK